MQIQGPENYKLSYTPSQFTVSCADGSNRFSGIAKSRAPKLYIASINGTPIYVGITKQPMQQRLRYGWTANGKSGYHGYAWRRNGAAAELSVWAHSDAIDRNTREIETVEAEVVFLIRKRTGQWPAFQTEIHFYQSTDRHREIASQILAHFAI